MVGMKKLKRGNKFKTSKFRTSSKWKRKGIQVTGKWKPIEIDPNLFSDEQLGGDLVCFEELTDYKLVASSKVGTKKVKKRKFESVCEEEKNLTTPKKKRKKDKGLKAKIIENDSPDAKHEEVIADEEDKLGGTIVGAVGVEDETGGSTKKRRNQKKKKKKVKKKLSPPQEAPPPAKSTKKAKNWTANVLSTSSDEKADVSAWKGLFVPKPVLQALSCLGFSAPTPIQALALPSAIRDRKDVLGAAETGSGKTLAFAIPMIHFVLQWQKSKGLLSTTDSITESLLNTNDDRAARENDGEAEAIDTKLDEDHSIDDEDESSMLENVEFDVGANTHVSCVDESRPLLGLVLTPTRELAVQVKHHIDAVAKFTGIKTALIVGGMAAQKQERVLKGKPEIIIATPGRLWQLIQERHLRPSALRQLRCLVIDEADRMVEKGHFLELSQLLEILNDLQHSHRRQTFVFSATLTLVHQAPNRVLQKKNAKNIDKNTKLEMLMQKVGIKSKAKVIDLTRKEATVETLMETRIHCEADEKDYYLYYFVLQYPGRTMVFANSIDCIKRLSAVLTILDCDPLPLHAHMHQKQRLKNLEKFAERENCVLLTTDVAARGLDIPNVQHVLHYEMPRTSEIYVHRSGRTARATNEGLTLLLIGPGDMVNFKKTYKTLGKSEELPFFPVETKCMSAIKERVNLARKIEKVEYFNCRAKQHNSWFKQAAEALEIDLDDDVLIGGQSSEEEESQKQKMLKSMRKQLKHLLSQPVLKDFMKTKYPTQAGKLLLPHLPANSSESALSTVSKQQVKMKKKKPIPDQLDN
uniref:ATP-dependent RNA helicase n=1 Tax=Sphenodon punctatus TaxID=8508 RepID=A0A8D0HKC9_SPHPU